MSTFQVSGSLARLNSCFARLLPLLTQTLFCEALKVKVKPKPRHNDFTSFRSSIPTRRMSAVWLRMPRLDFGRLFNGASRRVALLNVRSTCLLGSIRTGDTLNRPLSQQE